MPYHLKMLVLASSLLMAITHGSERLWATSLESRPNHSAPLIAATADDFGRNVAPKGILFRNVQAGVMKGENGTERHLFCGEFRAPGTQDWSDFATIETAPYELWLGAVATAHCTAPGTTLETGRDWSTPLAEAYGQRK